MFLIPSVAGTFHCCHLGFPCKVALCISSRFSRWRLMDNAAWPVTRRKCTFITTLYPTGSHTQLKVINSYTMVEIIVNLWYFFIWNVENITLNLHTIYHIEILNFSACFWSLACTLLKIDSHIREFFLLSSALFGQSWCIKSVYSC